MSQTPHRPQGIDIRPFQTTLMVIMLVLLMALFCFANPKTPLKAEIASDLLIKLPDFLPSGVFKVNTRPPSPYVEALVQLEQVLTQRLSFPLPTQGGHESTVLQATLGLLRFERYGSSGDALQDHLWQISAGLPAPSVLELLNASEYRDLAKTKTLWQGDLPHMLAVLDVYLSRDLAPQENENGLPMSFSGDLLTAILKEDIPSHAIGTDKSAYFGREDFYANLHGTLMAIHFNTFSKTVRGQMTLSDLLSSYERYYCPTSTSWRPQWTHSLAFQFGSLDQMILSIKSDLSIDETTAKGQRINEMLKALKRRLQGM